MAKEDSGANAERVKMTVRVQAEIYQRLHTFCESTLATHNAVAERAISEWIAKQDVTRKQARGRF